MIRVNGLSRFTALLSVMVVLSSLQAAYAAVAPPAEKPLQIIVSPRGDDANDGLTLDTPIKTLKRAERIAERHVPNRNRNVEIRIAPGTYEDQRVSWSFTMPKHTVTFMPLLNDGVQPTFDGSSRGGTFFTLRAAKGERTSIHLKDLRIQNYQTAVSFEGARSDPAKGNSHNRITGCIFNRIGSVGNPRQWGPSTAAIRFINSSNNVIDDCVFVEIRNGKREDGGLIHAVYLAHNSTRNKIRRSKFEHCSGDPIRIRDASNSNIVENNTFTRAGESAAVTEWYCHPKLSAECSKKNGECPSWSNLVRANMLVSTFSGERLPVFKILVDIDAPSSCPKPPRRTQRLTTSGNIIKS